jgi:hypothetical protein
MDSLLTLLKQEGVLKSEKVYNTMLQVDRGDFCEKDPYNDM